MKSLDDGCVHTVFEYSIRSLIRLLDLIGRVQKRLYKKWVKIYRSNKKLSSRCKEFLSFLVGTALFDIVVVWKFQGCPGVIVDQWSSPSHFYSWFAAKIATYTKVHYCESQTDNYFSIWFPTNPRLTKCHTNTCVPNLNFFIDFLKWKLEWSLI